MGRRRDAQHRKTSAREVMRQPAPTQVAPTVGDAGGVNPPLGAGTGQPRRLAVRVCGWCGRRIIVKATGRLPKWCSPSCRQRAWEQARAAASGRSAVQVVERRVEVPVPLPPTRRDWPRLLGELAAQLNDGRIYNRDLDDLSVALTAAGVSMTRRLFIRSRTAPRPH
jgi:hypothetical protein